MVILGGVASNSGVALGTFVFVFLLQYINATKYLLQNILPFDVTWLEYLLFGSMLIVIMYVRPQGLIKEKPSATLNHSEISGIMENLEGKAPPKDSEKGG
jgi:branched-chain amino acid transport system permease protein